MSKARDPYCWLVTVLLDETTYVSLEGLDRVPHQGRITVASLEQVVEPAELVEKEKRILKHCHRELVSK